MKTSSTEQYSSPEQINNKANKFMNILIIGATSGIGYRLWQHYASKGHNVAITGRRKELLDEMEKEYPEQTWSMCCDISDIKATTELYSSLPKKFKKVDMAIICAGVGELNPELDVMTELATVAVNVDGWTNTVATLYKLFEKQQSGHLVVLTSVGGLQPTPVAPSYSASKAFQINYIKSLQQKSKHTPIVITEIRPGLVDTRMAKGEGLFWVMPLDKVVPMIVNAISKKKKLRVVTNRWRIINWILWHFM